MKKTALLVLDSQKLELNIPLKEIYDFVSDIMRKRRFGRAKAITMQMLEKGKNVKAVALDGKTAEFFKKQGIPYIPRTDVTESLYDSKYGEKSFNFLRNLEKAIAEVDPQSEYQGIFMPKLDEKNLWRTFIFPAIKSVDAFNELIKKYRPTEAIILNREHFYQKLFMITAQNSRGVAVSDYSRWFSGMPWRVKQRAMKSFGFIAHPRYLRGLKERQLFGEKGKRKKIIIVHDTIHPAKIIPWAKKLTTKYEVIYVGVAESGREFEKAGIKYKKLQDYTNEDVLRNIEIMSSVHKKDFEKVFGNPKIRAALTYNNIDLSSALGEMFMYLYFVGYPVLVSYIELFSKMIAAELPALIITVDELSRFGRTLIEVANRNDVKTLIVQHGSLWDHPLFDKTKCTKFAAYGKQTEKILRSRGAKSRQIEITGQAEAIPELGSAKLRQRICTKLSLSRKKPVIMFASQAFPDSVNYPNFDIFYKTVKDLPEIQFVVKLHPDETRALHYDFIRKLGLKNVTIVKDISTKELIVASDLVVNLYSTVGMEALSLGKPLVSININLPHSYFPKGAGAYIIDNSGDLKKAIIQSRKIPASRIRKTGRYYIRETGEKACKDVVALAEKMLK